MTVIGTTLAGLARPGGIHAVFILQRRLRGQHRFDHSILLWWARKISTGRLGLTQLVELLDRRRRQIIAKAPVIAHPGAHHVKTGGRRLFGFVDRTQPPIWITAKRHVDQEFHVMEHGLRSVSYWRC